MNYLLKTVLSNKYEFITTSDVFQGIHELKNRQEIDLVMIDVDYDPQESWNFIQHIQTSGLYQDVPVIVFVSKGSKALVESKLGFEADHFFYKPFSPMDVIKAVDALVYATVRD
jgi:DNA-binding response OmpR family regulator